MIECSLNLPCGRGTAPCCVLYPRVRGVLSDKMLAFPQARAGGRAGTRGDGRLYVCPSRLHDASGAWETEFLYRLKKLQTGHHE